MVFEHNLRVSITGYILWGGHPYFQECLLTFRDFGIWHQKVAKFDNVDCTNNFSKNEHVSISHKQAGSVSGRMDILQHGQRT